MAITRGYVAGLLLSMLGCSGDDATTDDAAPVDAAVAIDAAETDAAVVPTCTCCTRLPFTAAEVRDVASDGTTYYVSFRSSSSSPWQLGTVSGGGGGGAPAMIDEADDLVLAAFQSTVFYAAATGTSYELHQRTGTVDDVLGSVTSVVPVRIAGNATDLYVFGSETADTSTLWRLSRATPGGTPAVVATAAGEPRQFALGATMAEMTTSASRSVVAIPGPSTPESLPAGASGLVFSGDTAFQLRLRFLTSNATEWRVERVLPTQATIHTSAPIIRGGYGELRADASHLYFHVTSGSLAPGSVTSRSLARITLEGSPREAVCWSWPSDILRLDATRVLGLEPGGDGQWFVDVLAKP